MVDDTGPYEFSNDNDPLSSLLLQTYSKVLRVNDHTRASNATVMDEVGTELDPNVSVSSLRQRELTVRDGQREFKLKVLD